MEHPENIGFQVRVLSHQIQQLLNQLEAPQGESPVTGLQGWVIGYLYHSRDRDVYQRDIQAQFSISRSAVTALLQTMEKNGLITRASVEKDARLKKLSLTPRAMKLHEEVLAHITQVEEILSSALTAKEKETFLRLCGKIRTGIEAHCGDKS